MTTNNLVQRIATENNPQESSTPRRFLRIQSVLFQVGLGRSAVYQLIKAKDFPAPYKIGGGKVSVWLESEIDNWIEQQVAASKTTV